MRTLLLALGLLALAACSSAPAVAPPPAPPVITALEPPKPAPVPDTCGAAELQHLIGRSRLESPVPIRPERQRVSCTTCPAAEDRDESRLNILFDAGTGRITEVRCG